MDQENVWYFENGQQFAAAKADFPFLILSMSDDYEFENVLDGI